MLVSELQQVVEIDGRISEMHQELLDLYRQRSSLVMAVPAVNAASKAAATTGADETWALQAYEQLAEAWKRQAMTIPGFAKLKPKLLKAYKILEQVSVAKPELRTALVPLLVPPSKDLPAAQPAEAFEESRFVLAPEYVEAKLAQPKADRSWRLLLAYAEPEGLYLGSPEQIMADKRYLIAGCDTRALGVREYSALALQQPEAIDTASWTLLLKNYKTNAPVPCASFDGRAYRLSVEVDDSVFGDDRFRPAIAIN